MLRFSAICIIAVTVVNNIYFLLRVAFLFLCPFYPLICNMNLCDVCWLIFYFTASSALPVEIVRVVACYLIA